MVIVNRNIADYLKTDEGINEIINFLRIYDDTITFDRPFGVSNDSLRISGKLYYPINTLEYGLVYEKKEMNALILTVGATHINTFSIFKYTKLNDSYFSRVSYRDELIDFIKYSYMKKKLALRINKLNLI